jgi:hypothetical protein
MSTKESKADRITRLFERKVILDELDMEDLIFITVHIQQGYVAKSVSRSGKKAKSSGEGTSWTKFKKVLNAQLDALSLPWELMWASSFASYLYTNKNWKEDTDKLEDEEEVTRLYHRFTEKNPLPEKKEKKEGKVVVKKVVSDSEDDEPAVRPGSAKQTDEVPKKVTPKKVAKKVVSDSEDDSTARETSSKKETKKKVVEESDKEDDEPQVRPGSAKRTDEEVPKKVTKKVKPAPIRMTPEGGSEIQTIKGVEYRTFQEDGKLKVWTIVEGEDGEEVGVYNFKTKEIDTEEESEE